MRRDAGPVLGQTAKSARPDAVGVWKRLIHLPRGADTRAHRAVAPVVRYPDAHNRTAALDFPGACSGCRYCRGMLHRVTDFVVTQWGVPADQLEIALQPIGSGLESTVARARISVNGVPLAQAPSSVVVKILRGSQRREAAVYHHLWSSSSPPPLAQVLGVQECDDDQVLLYLEELSLENEWP